MMICVTKIEALEVPDDWHRIGHYPDRELWLYPPGDNENPEPVSMKVVSEIVRGTRIVTSTGKEICIGMSKQAHELLGLPFEIIDNQKGTIEIYYKEVLVLKRDAKLSLAVGKRLRQKLDVFLGMNFWERLKFLFVKRKGEEK